MNDHNLEQLLNAWMDLGPTTAPDRVADAARLEARATRQVPAVLDRWAPRRFPDMNTTVRYVLAAAAVGVAAFIGFNYLVAPNLGSPGADDPSPTPVASATPAPLEAGQLAPGQYVIDDVITADIILTLPSGWLKNVSPAVVWTSDSEASLGFSTGDDDVIDSCDGTAPISAVGPSVDDFRSALESVPGFEAGPRIALTVDGYAGTQLELTATCAEALDSHVVYWIIDVDGERLVIQASDRPGAVEIRVSEMQTMVDTLQIEP